MKAYIPVLIITLIASVCNGQTPTDKIFVPQTPAKNRITEAINQTPPAIDISTGSIIPDEGYCDQPYVVKLKDGTWLCTMTTGKGHEGQKGQHIVSCRSSDRGKTWEPHVDIEPADGPEASWVMPYLTKYGRVYVFYTYNAKNMREVIASTSYARKRVDTLGEYAFKYSDDGGKSWSGERWFIPVRETRIDRNNPYRGKVRFFWGVGKPLQHKNAMYFGFTKVGKFGANFIALSEGWFLRCANIDTERNPDKLIWQTLPEGDHGLKSPKGPIASEVNLTSLSDGSLFCTYRTVAGHPCHAYSRDDGKTWTKSAFMSYGPKGKLVDNPRAANFVRKLTGGPYKGRYIYWFHNNKTKGWGVRNPAYLLGGTEVNGPGGKHIQWGEPVAVLYDRNPETRISYPDFIWDDGLYITETQKSIARVHRIPDRLLRSLWEENNAEQTPAGDALKAAPEEVPVKEVRVVLPGEDSEQMKRIASVFARQVEERCSAKVTTQGEAPLTVTLAVNPKIGKEGFRISDRDDGGIEVVGQNERGVLYGLGKLLRTSRYSKDGFAAGAWRGESVPQKPIRGIYFATHFHNFYHDAPVEKIQRYVEDLALWGFNELLVCYDMHHFNGADDPAAVTFRARLRAILLVAKRVGMDVSLVLPANEGYANSPKEMRAQGGGRGAIFKCYVCPNKPEGMQYILKVLGEEFDWAADLKPRSIWIWPYDSGGCGCKACQPWGSTGFMTCVREVGKLAREKIPGTKIFLSTWFMKGNEWRGIKEQLAQDKGLVDGIISEPGPHGIRIAPEDHGLPMIGFPEISMHGTFPWGGFGATPQTARARSQWNGVKATHAGGFPYSEGIYEDLTKVVFSQLYWNDRPVEETVKEYIAFEFSPDVVEDVYGVVKTLEQNHHWRWWPGKLEGVKLAMNWFPSRGAKPQADPGAEEAYATMKRVDKLLPLHVRKAWRWRQLYLRALLDAELKANGGAPNDLCNQAFAELIEIYHAQNAEPHVRPPLVK